MGHVAVSQRVIARNRFGQFRAALSEAATATVKDAIDDGAAASRALAPMDTGRLAGSIESEMTGATSGHWFSDVAYALHQEFGTKRHRQTGWVNFFWEKAGRDWVPGENEINHPGNPPHPYLRPAYEAVMARIMQIARRNYPG